MNRCNRYLCTGSTPINNRVILNCEQYQRRKAGLIRIRNQFLEALEFDEEFFAVKGARYWTEDANVKLFLTFVGKKLGIHKIEDWYKITSEDLKDFGGKNLFKSRGSLQKILVAQFPEKTWLPWRFRKAPAALLLWMFWNDIENQKLYMRWLGQKLGRSEGDPEAWYSISAKDFQNNDGVAILRIYKESPYRLLSTLYPKSEWLPWRFETVPRGFWDLKGNHSLFLDWLGRKLGYNNPEDWYGLTHTILVENGGKSLLTKYSGVYPFVSALKPDLNLLPWKFASLVDGYWDDEHNRAKYIDWLVKEVGVLSRSELTTTHFLENSGTGLLNKYSRSLSKVLDSIGTTVEPRTESKWSKQNYFESVQHRREFADHLAKCLGFNPNDEDRWYTVRISDAYANGGGWLLRKHYGQSIYRMLRDVYPSVDWKPWRFVRAPVYALNDPDMILKALKYVEKILNFQSLSDWNRVTENQLRDLKMNRFFTKQGGLLNVLRKSYPSQDWNLVSYSVTPRYRTV